MPLLDRTRRWINDRMTSDENISGTPREKIRDLYAALPHMTPQERQVNLEHVKAYVNYYHLGHQREAVPLAIQRSLNTLVNEANRLTAVDQARAVLQQHGGPPTRETIEQSLQRSIQERSNEIAQNRPMPAHQTELSWKDLHPQHEHKQEHKHQQSVSQGMGVSA